MPPRNNSISPLKALLIFGFLYVLITLWRSHSNIHVNDSMYQEVIDKLVTELPQLEEHPFQPTTTTPINTKLPPPKQEDKENPPQFAPAVNTTINRTFESVNKTVAYTALPATKAPTDPCHTEIPRGLPYDATKGVVEGIVDFERQENVVFATKIHGTDDQVVQVIQCICLFTQAYNRKVNYDIVIFSTLPISEERQKEIRGVAAPAKVTVVVDEQTLQEQLHDMSEEQVQTLINRCDNVNSTDQFEWGHRCHDIGSWMPLAYTWMSEFRSKQIWSQKSLAEYKYMLWMDSDAFCRKEWEQDPVSFMIRNDLVMLAANFPTGSIKYELPEVHKIIRDVYGKALCAVTRDREGKTFSDSIVETWDENVDPKKVCRQNKIPLIHGFMHITNLDFYRSDVNMRFYDQYIGDGKFRRSRDDQGAVTIPAAVLEPKRTWDMRANGIALEVAHNSRVDGKYFFKCGGFRKWWKREKVAHRSGRSEGVGENLMKCDYTILANE